LDQSFSITELAKQFGYSKEQFIRIFKDGKGVTPSLYFQTIKINRAKQWLADSEMSIMEIANKLGYEYQSNFCRMFKDFTNMNPMTYRHLVQRRDDNFVDK
jgi:AraC-like DNA-binding protein